MKNNLILISLVLLYSCGISSEQESIYVKDSDELHTAISEVSPGGEIVMANGIWDDNS